MTSRSRTALKSLFETGDVPDGSDYADIFDSFVSISDTSSQSVISDISFQNTSHVAISAGQAHVTGILRLGDTPIFAQTTANVSAPTSATMYGLITVSGVSYGVKLYNV